MDLLKELGINYLTQKLDTLFPGFRLLYENTSGFIHFSSEHMKLNTDIIDDGNDFIMKIRLAEITEFSVSKKVDYAFNMFQVSKELYKLLTDSKIFLS